MSKAAQKRFALEAANLNTTISTIVDARERAWQLLTDEQRRQCLVPSHALSAPAGCCSSG